MRSDSRKRRPPEAEGAVRLQTRRRSFTRAQRALEPDRIHRRRAARRAEELHRWIDLERPDRERQADAPRPAAQIRDAIARQQTRRAPACPRRTPSRSRPRAGARASPRWESADRHRASEGTLRTSLQVSRRSSTRRNGSIEQPPRSGSMRAVVVDERRRLRALDADDGPGRRARRAWRAGSGRAARGAATARQNAAAVADNFQRLHGQRRDRATRVAGGRERAHAQASAPRSPAWRGRRADRARRAPRAAASTTRRRPIVRSRSRRAGPCGPTRCSEPAELPLRPEIEREPRQRVIPGGAPPLGRPTSESTAHAGAVRRVR